MGTHRLGSLTQLALGDNHPTQPNSNAPNCYSAQLSQMAKRFTTSHLPSCPTDVRTRVRTKSQQPSCGHFQNLRYRTDPVLAKSPPSQRPTTLPILHDASLQKQRQSPKVFTERKFPSGLINARCPNLTSSAVRYRDAKVTP